MRRMCLWLVACVVLGLGTGSLSAGTNFTKGNVQGTWNLWIASGTHPNGLTPCTDYLGNASQCGYKYTTLDPSHLYSFLNPSGTGFSSFVGWHNYTGPNTSYSCNNNTGSGASFYLNNCLVLCTNAACTSNHLGFSLAGSAALNIITAAPVNQFRNPVNDAGYFLSAAGSGMLSDKITISAPSGKYFSAFDLYWGSVDPWNSVTFNPSGGACNTTNICTTVYGTDLGFTIADLNHTSSTGNQNSATIEFTPVSGKSNWHSITFTACSDPSDTALTHPGICYPAFELDNLQFKLTSVPSTPGLAPVPEPSSMVLLGSGFASVALLLRRKLRG
jgi:hypothetical protein